MSRRIAEVGYSEVDVKTWTAWPWDGELSVRGLQPPAEQEPDRGGAGGENCHSCATAAHIAAGEIPEQDAVVWFDDDWFLAYPRHGSPFPFAGFLMPRRHADLQDLKTTEATRQGELFTAIESVACEVLEVPRMQVARWGDGGEHLHWWLYARPTGALQLRGTFLALWEIVLPEDEPAVIEQAMRTVSQRLVQRVGGTAAPFSLASG